MPESPRVPDGPSASEPPGVRVDVEHRDGVVVLRVEGELDMLTTPTLAESIMLALGNHPEVLVVDLTDVTFLGSSALGVLVTARQEAVEGTALRVVVTADGLPARVLDTVGLDSELAVYTSLEAAIAG